MKKLAVVYLGASLLLAGHGCGSPEPKPGKTPKEIVARLAQAMYEGNKIEMLACFTGTDQEKRPVESIANFMVAALTFKEAFIETYGQEEWDKFQDPEKKPKEGDAEFFLITKEKLERMKRADVRIEGEKAFFLVPNGPAEALEAVIVRQADGWLIQASSFLPVGAEPVAFSNMMDGLAAVVVKYHKAIGHEGLTPEDIDAELGMAMIKAILGFEMTTPHRFNIDEIQ